MQALPQSPGILMPVAGRQEIGNIRLHHIHNGKIYMYAFNSDYHSISYGEAVRTYKHENVLVVLTKVQYGIIHYLRILIFHLLIYKVGTNLTIFLKSLLGGLGVVVSIKHLADR